MDTLIPVIVGGIIGLAGGLLGPPLAHWLNERAAKKKKRAEKLEELIGALYAYAHWLALVRGIRVFGHELTEPPSPLPTARAIAVIYFPDLDGLLTELEDVARPYEVWMLEAGKKRLDGNIKEVQVGFDDVYRRYWFKFNDLMSALKKFAMTESAR